MQSNSKLDPHQNQWSKAAKCEHLAAGGVLVAVDAVTVALLRTGEQSGKFAVSIASPDEKKIRRKVGEYHALDRFATGNTLPVSLLNDWDAIETDYADDADYLESVARGIAFTLQP